MNSSLPKRRGRPPGSVSCVKVKLQDLLLLVGESAVVPVSSAWLKAQQINIEQKVNIISIKPPQNETQNKISFRVENLQDEPLEEWAPDMHPTDDRY